MAPHPACQCPSSCLSSSPVPCPPPRILCTSLGHPHALTLCSAWLNTLSTHDPMRCHRPLPRRALPTLLTGRFPGGPRVRPTLKNQSQGESGKNCEARGSQRQLRGLLEGACEGVSPGYAGSPLLGGEGWGGGGPTALVGSAWPGERQAAGLGGERGGRRLSCSRSLPPLCPPMCQPPVGPDSRAASPSTITGVLGSPRTPGLSPVATPPLPIMPWSSVTHRLVADFPRAGLSSPCPRGPGLTGPHWGTNPLPSWPPSAWQ